MPETNSILDPNIVQFSLELQDLLSKTIKAANVTFHNTELNNFTIAVRQKTYIAENAVGLDVNYFKKFIENARDTLTNITSFLSNNSPASSAANRAEKVLFTLELLYENLIKSEKVIHPEFTAQSEQAVKLSVEISALREASKTTLNELNNRMELLSDRALVIEKNISDLEMSASTPIEQAYTTLSESRNYVDTKKEEIDRILALVSETAVRAHYQKNSENEKKAANHYRLISSILILAPIIFLGYMLLKTSSMHFDGLETLQKIAVTLVLLIPSAYFAKESSRHRDLQNLYLQKAMILATIDAYTSTLPPEEVVKIKLQLTTTLFSLPDHKNDSFPINAHEIAIALVEKLTPQKKN